MWSFSMGHLGENGLNFCELENEVTLCFGNEVIDKERASIQDAVKVLLMGLGEDVKREGIIKTPFRVAKALSEGTIGYSLSAKEIVEGALFPEAGVDKTKVGHAGGVGGLVIVRDLDFYSYCESCMLPFYFKCHVGYVPSGQRVLGLSKLSRVTNVFAKRLQEPQRLANEVCFALDQGIEPQGVAVVLQCSHVHFPGTKQKGSLVEEIFVSSGSGVFENNNSDMWGDFLGLLKFRGVDRSKVHVKGSSSWCPALDFDVSPNIGVISPTMVNAVSSILKSLGEDPTRKELVGTPSRFVKWLMNFQCCENDNMKLNGYLKTNGDVMVSFGDKEVHSEINLPFWSQCEHHLLPFHGVVHIGYFISKGCEPIARSLIQSIVHFYGYKLQVQERVTKQIAETISPIIGGNVIVVVEASHTCMMSRGIEKFGSNTATIAVLGCFSTDIVARTKFLESIPSAATSL